MKGLQRVDMESMASMALQMSQVGQMLVALHLPKAVQTVAREAGSP